MSVSTSLIEIMGSFRKFL